jgi:hypothetical protein
MSEIVQLSGLEGFSAQVDRDRWLTVGEEAVVNRSRPPQSWPGRVAGFAHGQIATATYRLKSGDDRDLQILEPTRDRFALGDTFPVDDGYGHSWTATIGDVRPATRVTITYVIKNGSVKRRDFYFDEPLVWYAVPNEDGTVTVKVPH